jgi:hypothetical protein
MKIYKEEALHIVADLETGLVYIPAPSANCATALTYGLINSGSFSFPIQLPVRKKEWDDCDFHNDLYQMLKTSQVRPFPKELVREDLLKRRALAKMRAVFLYSLEVHFQRQLHRIAEYMPDDLSPFIYDELNRCDPSQGKYTNAIEEYASLHEIGADAAYDELRMKLQSNGIAKFRNYARYEKYMMQMNKCVTRQQLNAVLDTALGNKTFAAGM